MMLKGSLLLWAGNWLIEAARRTARDSSGAQLLITADVGSFAEETFLAWNASQDMRSNMISAFKHFVQRTGLTKELSALEERDYMERFIGDCQQRLQGLQVEVVNREWSHALKEALDDEMPQVTDKSVESLNSQGLGWKSKKHDEVAVSRREFKNLLGLIVPKESEIEDIEREAEPVARIQARSSNLPSSFDSRSKWPRCADVFVRPSNQGTCGSCWAFAGGSNLDHRMCIATNGSTKVALSRQYILTCMPEKYNYGCNGGWSTRVFSHFFKVGIPSQSCSPYLGTDEYGCPSKCKSGYPRSLQSDMYLDASPKGNRNFRPEVDGDTAHTQAQLELYQNGPVTGAVPASPYGEWLSYDSGFFEGDCTASAADHAVVAIGWSTKQGRIYYTTLNSWGVSWGDKGTMKLAKCNYVWLMAPGPIDVPAHGWPWAIR